MGATASQRFCCGSYASTETSASKRTTASMGEQAKAKVAEGAAAMAAVQGKLYTAGGYLVGAALATAEAFDPQQNRWEAVAPMATAGHNLAAATI